MLLFFIFQVLLPGASSPVAVALWLSASGGTFLYASCMHVLPHVASSGHRLTNSQVAPPPPPLSIPLSTPTLHGFKKLLLAMHQVAWRRPRQVIDSHFADIGWHACRF